MQKKDNKQMDSGPRAGPGLVVDVSHQSPTGSLDRSSRLPAVPADSTDGCSVENPAQLKYADLLNSIVDGVLVLDSDGNIVEVNERSCELLQMTASELTRLQIHHLVPGADRSLMPSVDRLFDNSRHVRIETDLQGRDGRTFAAEIHARIIRAGDSKGSKLVCLFVRKSGGETVKSNGINTSVRGFDTAATVAGQVAHDLDNLLSQLTTYPELIKKDLPEKCSGRDLLNLIEKAAIDMSRITQQLLVLSKRGRHKAVSCNINELVQHVSALLRDGAIARGIEINTHLSVDLLPIKGAPEQVFRVIQNLCQNAIDAIEDTGRVDLSTRNVYLDRPAGHCDRLRVGEYVQLSVADNGSGIPDDIREKIFHPFFTTKKSSAARGAGLGLSVVRGIVDDHNGCVDFESTLGKGTVFNLYFPIFREEPDGTDVRKVPEKGKSVLVVDDDSQQRDILAQLLQYHGYKTMCLPSGEKALDYVAECAVPSVSSSRSAGRFPDFIFLDVVMDPGMDGREACKRILEINPGQRVIMVSGYPAAAQAGIRQLVNNVSYLGKPLTWHNISRELQSDQVPQLPKEKSLVPRNMNRILVVDDEEGIRRLFHMILSAAFPKLDVELASNGTDALAMFKQGHHAAIVLDLRMPVMDGHTAFLEIRKFCGENRWEEPSVLFCTGFAPPDVVRRIASSHEGHSILTKPVSGDALVSAVNERIWGTTP